MYAYYSSRKEERTAMNSCFCLHQCKEHDLGYLNNALLRLGLGYYDSDNHFKHEVNIGISHWESCVDV